MLVEVRRPYVDISAHELSLTLGAPPAPAIEVLRVSVGGHAIELRLLACSHQAVIEGEAGLSETVACVPGAPGTLPQRRTDGAYSFRAHVERLDEDAYAKRAAVVLARAASDPHALAGVFAPAPGAPGSQPAFTVLAAHPPSRGAGIAWTTWHGYPQTGEIVVTASSLERGA